MSACEDRGADLLVAARGATPPDLGSHLAACAGCRAELESLRGFAGLLRSAREGPVPRASTREAVLAATAAAPPSRDETPLAPPPRRGGRILPFAIPAAVAAAAAGVFVALRPPPGGTGAGGAIEAAAMFGGTGLHGIGPAGLPAGTVLEASDPAGVRLGAPVHAEVVLGRGASLRVPADPGAPRGIDLLAGSIFASSGPDAPPEAGPLRVLAGALVIEDRGARFSVERTPDGGAVVILETGVAVLRVGATERAVSGPCRVEIPASGPPGDPVPAESTDATSWFAFPRLSLEESSRTDGGTDLVVTMTPSVPREIRIAPFHPRDPLFALLAEHPERGQTSVTLNPRMLRAPPPAAG
ncbi:MAG TPA: FecR family protein, partial [Planctomycetota bacterium]|nr:FecR family protein [Planctomycetota bacterium]